MSRWAEMSGRLRARLRAVDDIEALASGESRLNRTTHTEWRMGQMARMVANWFANISQETNIRIRQSQYPMHAACFFEDKYSRFFCDEALAFIHNTSAHCQFRIARIFNGGLPLIPTEALT